MNTIQYIGARYVPKFFEGANGSEWEPNISYEPLTIVTWLGSSWTSKKVVPPNIGAPNLNLEYWINTGNFNQQLESLQESVSELRDISSEQQGVIDDAVVSIDEIQRNISSAIASSMQPLYRGDFTAFGYFLSAVVHANDFIYAFCPNNRNDANRRSNIGLVKKYNFSTGELIGDYNIELGHAQSACYNAGDGFIYLVPMIDYSGVSDVRDRHLYKINPANLSIIDRIDTGFNIRNISYDPVTQKMYAMDDSMNIYLIGDSYTFNLIVTITEGFSLPEVIQDFAIYDNIIYMSSTLNRFIKCIWDGISSSITPNEIFICENRDSLDYWKIGEMEGIEFDVNGHLFGATFNAISPTDIINGIGYFMTNNIVVEIPMGVTAPYPLRGVRVTGQNRTYQIDQSYTNLYIESNLRLRDYYQIMALAHEYHSVYLTKDYTTGMDGEAELHIHKHTFFNLNQKTLKCKRIEIASDTTLYQSGTLIFTKDATTNGMIYITRGDLALGNNLNITVECTGESARDNNFVNPGAIGPEIWNGATVTCSYELRIGTHPLTDGVSTPMLLRGNRVLFAA